MGERMPRSLRIDWAGDSGEGGFETLDVQLSEGGVTFIGTVTGPADAPSEIVYVVTADAQWRTRTVTVADPDGATAVVLVSDGDGHWADGYGHPLSELDGATDVDIRATPSTNTLPIRRAGLGVGESVDIATAFVQVPGLEVTSDPQRYTRIAGNVYRFDSLTTDFTREITVDDDGFVVSYPGLFVRRPVDD